MVAGQALQFFAAGFETVSGILSFTLYELCIQPEIQNKLRDEILKNIKHYNGITYDGVSEMKYLDMCVAGINLLCSIFKRQFSKLSPCQPIHLLQKLKRSR